MKRICRATVYCELAGGGCARELQGPSAKIGCGDGGKGPTCARIARSREAGADCAGARMELTIQMPLRIGMH
jgi:hypothetical protein